MISSLELAKICGVSQGTVDRALHGRPGISSATRAKILAMARQYGYAPNPGARELMNRTSTLVGAVVPAGGGAFFLDLVNAVRAALAQEGLRLWIGMYENEEEFLDTVREFAARRVRGLALIPPQDNLELPEGLPGDIPAVTLIARCREMPLIAPDEVAAGRLAAEYLWSKGHRRLMHLTYPRNSIAINDRANGFEAALKERHAEVCILSAGEDEDLVRAVRQRRATALFCHNDWLALRASRALRQAGLCVPEEVSILGVDNSATFTQLCPGFTTLAYPMGDVAAACREVLLGRARPAPVGAFSIIERNTVRSL